MSFAKHYKTGAPLPDALFSKLDAAKNFRSASGLLRQARLLRGRGERAARASRACSLWRAVRPCRLSGAAHARRSPAAGPAAAALATYRIPYARAPRPRAAAPQVNLATKDLELYSSFVPGRGETIFDVDRRVGAAARAPRRGVVGCAWQEPGGREGVWCRRGRAPQVTPPHTHNLSPAQATHPNPATSPARPSPFAYSRAPLAC